MQYAHEKPSYERKLPKGMHASMPKLDASLWPEFDTYLLGRGLDPAIARANRWYPSRHAGDPRDGVPGLPRIVIPATNSTDLVYWQARAMVSTDKRYWSPSVQRGDSIITVWPDKSAISAPVVVVEGPTDALAAASSYYVGIALMGKTPNASILDFVATILQRRAMLIVADADSPADAARTLAYLASKGRRCKLLTTTPYKDLAKMPLLQRERLLKEASKSLSSLA